MNQKQCQIPALQCSAMPSFIYLHKQLNLISVSHETPITYLRAAQWTIVSHSIPELLFPAIQIVR